jgi:hypothetical protein
MARSRSQRCAHCGNESCSGECQREPPTERAPASVDRSKRRPVSDTIPDVEDDDDVDDDQSDDEALSDADSGS